jgi:hypothetical protein
VLCAGIALANITTKWKKPLIFTEIGYCSGDCPNGPGINIQHQTNHYKAVFEVFSKKRDWFQGLFWWNWLTDPAFGGVYNYCRSPQGKPAEELVRTKFGGVAAPPTPEFPPVCPCY